MTVVIGLTGGIASGKSVVSKMLADRGAPVSDADTGAHGAYAPGSACTRDVAAPSGQATALFAGGGARRWGEGLGGRTGGSETPRLYIPAAAALAFTGPGAYSLENALSLEGFAGNGWGVTAVVVGALSGLVVVARGRHALAADAAAQTFTPEVVPV